MPNNRWHWSVGIALTVAPFIVMAQCLAPLMPNDGNAYAFSPFGVNRTIGGRSSWHLGIDIQKPENVGAKGVTTPLQAPITGTVTVKPNDPYAGNMMVFRRADGMEVQYMHMHRFADKFQSGKGVDVKAGEYVGELGGTPHYGKHLHLGIKLPLNSVQDYRDRMFAALPSGSKKLSNLPFTADHLAAGHKPATTMVYVDPQYWLDHQYPWVGVNHYLSQGFRMAPGNKTFPATCTATVTVEAQQQQVINAMGGKDPGAMSAEQMDAAGIQDGDLIGTVDAPSYANYADLSEQDLIMMEAGRRMTDGGWDIQVASAGIRGLSIELARIRAAELFIQQRLEEKKKRVEALAAALFALRTRKLGN